MAKDKQVDNAIAEKPLHEYKVVVMDINEPISEVLQNVIQIALDSSSGSYIINLWNEDITYPLFANMSKCDDKIFYQNIGEAFFKKAGIEGTPMQLQATIDDLQLTLDGEKGLNESKEKTIVKLKEDLARFDQARAADKLISAQLEPFKQTKDSAIGLHEETHNIHNVIQLKNAGFTVDEIIKLGKELFNN